MKVQVVEMWVTPGSLVMKVEVWGSDGGWRQKRYSSVPLDDIPEEVLVALAGHLLDLGRDEDPQQMTLM